MMLSQNETLKANESILYFRVADIVQRFAHPGMDGVFQGSRWTATRIDEPAETVNVILRGCG